MSAVITAMADVLTVGTSVISYVTGNAVLTFFLAAAIIPIGIGLFRRLSR